MKKKICFGILIIFFLSITIFTGYILIHRSVRKEDNKYFSKDMELINESYTKEGVNFLYNINIDETRSRLKLTYELQKEEKQTNLVLIAYLNGQIILSEKIMEDVKQEDVSKIIKDEKNKDLIYKSEDLKLIKDDDKDYLVIPLTEINKNIVKRYDIFDSTGKKINQNKILIYDSSKEYIKNQEENIFYSEEKQILSTIKDNAIYSLEEKKEENQFVLEEYKITIKKDKLEKELVSVYAGISLK